MIVLEMYSIKYPITDSDQTIKMQRLTRDYMLVVYVMR